VQEARIADGKRQLATMGAQGDACWRTTLGVTPDAASDAADADNGNGGSGGKGGTPYGLEAGCADLTYENRQRLALALANCHLAASGLKTVPCPVTADVKACTMAIGSDDTAFHTFTQFYVHVDNICVYIRQDSFRQRTAQIVQQLYEAAGESARHLKTMQTQSDEHAAAAARRAADAAQAQTLQFEALNSGVAAVAGGVDTARESLQALGDTQTHLLTAADALAERHRHLHGKCWPPPTSSSSSLKRALRRLLTRAASVCTHLHLYRFCGSPFVLRFATLPTHSSQSTTRSTITTLSP
jgi:hypothetical protein